LPNKHPERAFCQNHHGKVGSEARRGEQARSISLHHAQEPPEKQSATRKRNPPPPPSSSQAKKTHLPAERIRKDALTHPPLSARRSNEPPQPEQEKEKKKARVLIPPATSNRMTLAPREPPSDGKSLAATRLSFNFFLSLPGSIKILRRYHPLS